MPSLTEWLDENFDALCNVAANRLSQSEAVQSEVLESVQAFFDGLLRATRADSPLPLNAILIDWVEARSAPTTAESTTVVPVLATLKEVLWEQIQERASIKDAVSLLIQSDSLFTQSIIYLSGLEVDALLDDMRRQLTEAQSDVQRLDKSKSNFIAVAAHELRTPLTLVEGYSDMIANSPLASRDSQIPLLLEGIGSGTRRLREIINDLIDVSLLDLGLMEFHFQPVWLLQIINAAEFNVRRLTDNRSVVITIDHDSISNQSTYGDPDRLLQALQKVLMNAVKYTPDRGSVTITGRDLPGFTDIMIVDTGIGIATDNLSRIFDSFSALGDSALHSSGKTKFKGGGPGLGLPIAKGIIEAHGGTIWAESDSYSEITCPGSTFHVMIPMHASPPQEPAWQSSKNIANGDIS